MRISVLLIAVSLYLFASGAFAEDDYQQVEVADPYLEIHTGPGAGYPVFYVVERGQVITIIKSHTDWFKVKTAKGKIGWVARSQMAQTLSPSGEKVELIEITRQEFEERRWEVGAMGGQLDGAPVLSVYGGYGFTPNLSAELTLSQSIGNVSSTLYLKGSLLASPFPDWRFSPYFSIGTGVMEIEPTATLIQPETTTHQFSAIGIGIRTHISQRFIFRVEYNDYVIYSASNDKDDNEEVGEWKIGFAVFF
ncbi:MAG: hypothetical protein AMJ55_04945 [Gammaproteobacteria bacterium SG8_15]|nr:MAG: hypothetical protein AMJ55_04945 [Gammaproteobacteria bacterium SG8_15]